MPEPGRRPAGLAEAAGGVAFAVAAGAMVALPLARRGRRALLANVVVAGLAGTTLAIAGAGWGPRRALGALGVVVGGAAAVERLGVATGVPFGSYRYTAALRPQVAGLPLAVPAAWFAMALPAREAAATIVGRHDAGDAEHFGPPAREAPATGRSRARRTEGSTSETINSAIGRIALGAACLTAWDLFLDPQMVREGYWEWCPPGRYRGVPLSNFAGWLVTSAVVMAALEVALPPRLAASPGPTAAAVGVYAWMAVMQTLGAAAFDRDPVVAATGGLATLAVAAAAVSRLRAGRLRAARRG